MTFEFSSDGPISCSAGVITLGNAEYNPFAMTDEEFLRACGIELKRPTARE